MVPEETGAPAPKGTDRNASPSEESEHLGLFCYPDFYVFNLALRNILPTDPRAER